MKLIEATREEIRGKIGLMPIGSIEQHGPHLPLGTDGIIAEWIAQRVEEKFRDKVLLYPTLYYGCSKEHYGFPHLSIGYINMFNFLMDIVTTSKNAGVSSLVIVNGHGGNESVLDLVRRETNMNGDKCFKVHVFSMVGRDRELFNVIDMHAGSAETSRIYAINKELVRKENLESVDDYTVNEGVFKTIPISEANKYGIINIGGKVEIDEDKGRKSLEKAVDELSILVSKIIEELKKCNNRA
ncbi:creatininase family protein [Stygiolobus caldivivus]|uniref:Creatininase n=1 Tax=Stygiolobus caldivivus TaxID=2824673 RepID=A0A8D5ZIV2_9CREN|nr:creatininase family protein [Stygiolobus caldivivus]BCU70919.1 creatininase [Stygiolobus caldivivus]